MSTSVLLYGQNEAWRRVLQASEPEQTAWIKSDLERGMPPVDPDGGVITTLILNRSELTLPLIEQKIEAVLRSPSSPDNFTDKSVDPQKFIDFAAVAIREAGNVQSLKELSKLIKIDERRFGYLVEQTLVEARGYRNPFTVAYQGFDIGDPAIDSRIAKWAEVQLADKRPPLRNFGARTPEPVPESEVQKVRTWWAEAMVDEYGGVPSEAQWRSDSIVSHLTPSQADSLHDDMIRRTTEVIEKRAKR